MAISYKSITVIADGFDAYCAPCGDFYIYECPTEDCGGLICVCCMDSCDDCCQEIDFTS